MYRTQLVCFLLGIGLCLPAGADLVKLKNGGEVRGKLDVSQTDGTQVTIRSMSGATIVISRADVEFATIRSMALEEYETRTRRLPDTVEAHWEMAEWCKQNRLRKQREEHLRNVLRLNNDHVQAHHALGQRKVDGKWMSKDEEMQAQGYVKYKGRYITPQQLELIEKTQEELEAERVWHKKIHLWTNWLEGRNPERQGVALVALRQISDPHAVTGLQRNLHDHVNKAIRSLYVDVLTRIDGPKPVAPLVAQSLNDIDHEIRYQALAGISEAQHAAATPHYLKALKSDLNTIVDRAGIALQQMADENSIPQLIDALVTTHEYRVVREVPNSGLSFGTDGSFQGNGNLALPPDLELMLRSGQLPNGVAVNQQAPPTFKKKRVYVIKHNHQNQSVLVALQKVTGKNFGFDERTWKLWYNAEKNGVAD